MAISTLRCAVGRLPALVERHDDDRRPVAADQPRLLEERGLAVLQGDRVDDGLALDVLQSPASIVSDQSLLSIITGTRAIDGLGGDEAQEARHRRRPVDHRLVEVDVDRGWRRPPPAAARRPARPRGPRP